MILLRPAIALMQRLRLLPKFALVSLVFLLPLLLASGLLVAELHKSVSFAGQVGVGLDYFLNHHLSFGIAFPFYLYPDLNTRIQYPGQPDVGGRVNFSGFAPQIHVTAYLN